MCIFFGRFKTETTLLLHLITFVNEHSDWQLRCAFFHNIVGVAAFVGDKSLELYILPCIEQALAGTASFSRTRRAYVHGAYGPILCCCYRCRRRRVRDRQGHQLHGLLVRVGPVPQAHPHQHRPEDHSHALPPQHLDSIRYTTGAIIVVVPYGHWPALTSGHLVFGRCAGVVALTEAISKQLSRADVFCFLFPILRPFLQCDIVHVTESNLLQALQSPVPSPAFPLLSSPAVRALCVCDAAHSWFYW